MSDFIVLVSLRRKEMAQYIMRYTEDIFDKTPVLSEPRFRTGEELDIINGNRQRNRQKGR